MHVQQSPGPPPVCYWYDDPHEGRWLVPGCLARAHDPDIDTCDCPTMSDQLAAAQAELDEARRRYAGMEAWLDAIKDAVRAHRDGEQIMRDAVTQSDRCSSPPEGPEVQH